MGVTDAERHGDSFDAIPEFDPAVDPILCSPFLWWLVRAHAGFTPVPRPRTMPKASAGRLADPNTDWDHPDNVIKLVDQTETEPKRVRLASPFTVESRSPYSYLPFDTAPDSTDGSAGPAQPSGTDLGVASGEITQTVIDALCRSPICDSAGKPLLHICWMIDTDHDQMSFIARLTYFPNGLRNDAGLKAVMRSLGPDLLPDAQSHIISFRSQPFPIPPDGRPIAVKTITDTGAEMNTVIHPDAWQALSDG